jgi:hypothetical protein
MKIYTYSDARQNLASVLDQARKEGAVGIRRKDGSTFVIKPEEPRESPFDVEGIDLGLTTEEIVAFIHEGRRGGD